MSIVDDQIENFERTLTANIEYALFVNISLNFWEEMDELDTPTLDIMRATVRDAFTDIEITYRETSVIPIVYRCSDILQGAIVVAMNVPFPRDPILHVHRVIQNLRELFTRDTYALLRTEMIMINHHAHILQRTWRRAISDPFHAVCRRRLFREFEKMGDVHAGEHIAAV
jgi:hypothetical protein